MLYHAVCGKDPEYLVANYTFIKNEELSYDIENIVQRNLTKSITIQNLFYSIEGIPGSMGGYDLIEDKITSGVRGIVIAINEYLLNYMHKKSTHI